IKQGDQRIRTQQQEFTIKQQQAQQRAAAKATQKQQAAQQKAAGARDKTFDQARTQAYAKARALANQTNPVTGLKTRMADKQAYRYLWNTYGRHLMRYTSASGRPAWEKKVDAMIRTAMLTAGYPPPASPYAPPVY